ncbi:MAG: VCBS repeat-containing protein [Flavitalea sp.]
MISLRLTGLALMFLFLQSCSSDTLFEKIPSSKSGIGFNNLIPETDSINILDQENVYNGGGVGIGDFNNDGLQDIYFTGNQVSNKLYLNKGDMKFEDVTEIAGVGGEGKWSRGVAVVDINADGLMDMYVCASIHDDIERRRNLLYINQGIKDGKPVFKNLAKEYGLDDTTHSTMASFFDYDNDGDLDVFIAVNQIVDGDFPNRFRPRLLNNEHPSTGKLYRNDFDSALNHALFTNVSSEAGTTIEGYSHAVSVSDINMDGWKDIYVTNDYLSTNVLYLNNKNGTFSDKISSYLKHTSANAMGCDINDINNDGYNDIIELDMNPKDNYRKKMMLNANSYQTYQNSDYFNYQYQYVRNVLQLNQGPTGRIGDSSDFIFSDIAFYSGIAETDWSWTPMVADFDNDGFRDIIITNGFPKDITDHDFITFRNEAFSIATKEQLLEQIPEVKIPNYGFRNTGSLQFEDLSKEWGLEVPGFSTGAAYADLDNDGDLDMVVNNINDEAFLYRNNARQQKEPASFIRLKLEGTVQNKSGIGSWINIYSDNTKLTYEQNPYRGYLSSIQSDPQFGLGKIVKIDSVVIIWPDFKKQVIKNIKLNELVTLKYSEANEIHDWSLPAQTKSLLKEITDSVGINYVHQERDFVDFNIQKLLPHKLSEYGPALTVGDVNGDGLQDIICSGAKAFSAEIFIQQPDGKFIQRALLNQEQRNQKQSEDAGILLFDADGDKDLDLYIVSGGYENLPETPEYQDQLYINDGSGNFTIDLNALPKNYTSKSCVKASDYDHDGDLDLFVGGRVKPSEYPKPVNSFIFRNDTKNGVIRFTDVTKEVSPELLNIGLVSDASWNDIDKDGWDDLVIAGEWMPITVFKNDKGKLKNITSGSGLEKDLGWWGSLASGDFDNDGDIDFVAGNLGLNSFYRASEKEPVKIYAKDFDNNQSYDAVPTLFLPTSGQDITRREFPAQTRDDLIKQMIFFRSKFQNYKLYADAPFEQIFTPEELKGALVLSANNFQHCFIRNNGNGKFELVPLPKTSQFSCINGMTVTDLNKDGNPDIIANGNDYGTEVSVGRYDACNGYVLLGDGKGSFRNLSILESGLFIPGNGKAMVMLTNPEAQTIFAASQNRGRLKIFGLNNRVSPDQQRKDLTLRK